MSYTLESAKMTKTKQKFCFNPQQNVTQENYSKTLDDFATNSFFYSKICFVSFEFECPSLS